MQTRLTLRHKPNSRLPLIRIGNQPTPNRCPPHLRLLRPLPPIRVTQDELHIVVDGGPESCPVRMGVGDEISGAAEEVGQEVTKDVGGGLVAGEGVEAHAVHLELHCFRTHAELEAALWVGC